MTITARPRVRRPSQLRLVDRVCQSLEEAILSEQLMPGERLIETDVARELGVARGTVREAFLMLQQRGLVVNEPRRGACVTRLTPEDALDLKVTRALLEAYAVRLGYARINVAGFAELDDMVEDMKSCVLPREFPRLVQIDLAFHRRLVESAGSTRLASVWSSLDSQIGALMLRGLEQRHATIDDIVVMHRQLLDAMRTEDPDVIETAVIDHYVIDHEFDDAAKREMVHLIEAVTTQMEASDVVSAKSVNRVTLSNSRQGIRHE